MTVPRRRYLKLMAGAACMPLVSWGAKAQSYPARPVRLLVGFAAGGSGDVLARLLAQWLTDRLKQTIIVENKVGAGGNIAIDTVLRSPADGLTLLMNTMPALITPPLPENFDLARECTPVAGAYQAYLLMLIHPSVPVATLPEFIAYAKANPGKISMASAGNGTAPHMAGELFKMMTGLDIVHVPYRGGGPALTDLPIRHRVPEEIRQAIRDCVLTLSGIDAGLHMKEEIRALEHGFHNYLRALKEVACTCGLHCEELAVTRRFVWPQGAAKSAEAELF